MRGWWRDYSFAAGRKAKANHAGTFVWADSTDADFTSERDKQFRGRANGGARFDDGAQWVDIRDDGTNLITSSTGARLTLAGAWANASARELKENNQPIDGRDVLRRLSTLPISSWNYKIENAGVRHIGPMAQDFYDSFGLGDSEKSITTIDSDGVALAAIQGLYEIVKEKECEIETLRAEKDGRITDLEARLAAIEELLKAQQGGGR